MNIQQQLDILGGRKLQGRMVFQGLNISIENKKDSIRSGVSPQGVKWAVSMKHRYGYIRLTKGSDGEHVDCYVGPHLNATNAYIVDQNNPETKEFDEQKVMLGFKTSKDAKQAYLDHYNSEDFFGKMHTIPMEKFKKKVLQRTGKPLKAESVMSTPADAGFEVTNNPGKKGKSLMPKVYDNTKLLERNRDAMTNRNQHPVHINTTQVGSPQGSATPIGTQNVQGILLGETHE